MEPTSIRVACDSLVALGASTDEGATIFAKNSDRPSMECQPMASLARRMPSESSLRCTYIEIPQVRQTWRVLGSRPYWCWGFEHGLNEHGVAIGNHTVFTKDTLAGQGLIGMDLVRLALERASEADEAIETICTLLNRYGQGGSGYADKEWPYHNSFLVADPSRAYLLETSDRDWAIKHVSSVASLSNHVSITSDWDSLSPNAVSRAIQNGWWDANSRERFDFASAYRDIEMAPPVISSGRYGRTCALLESATGRVSVEAMKRFLRDHYGNAWPAPDLDPSDERFFSVCMHSDPVGTTTASMVASLHKPDHGPNIYWASLGSPCVGVFLPIPFDAELPAALTVGGAEASSDSLWWSMKKLVLSVAADWPNRFPAVRTAMDRFEREAVERMQAAGEDPSAQSRQLEAIVGDLVRLSAQRVK